MSQIIEETHRGHIIVITPNHQWYLSTTVDIYASEDAYEGGDDPLISRFAQDEEEADAFAREWIDRMLRVEDSPFISKDELRGVS